MQNHSYRISNAKSKRAPVLFTWLGILLLVEQGEYAARIASRLNKSPQRISYHLARLRRLGYLETCSEQGKRSYPIFYRLTDKARSLRAQLSKKIRRARFRFHHYALRYRITRDNPDFLPISAGTQLRGGVVQVDGKVDGYSVRRFASPSAQWLFLYSRPHYGDEPWKLLAKASIELHCLSQEICRRHDMELMFEDIMQKAEYDVPSDRFAKFWGENVGATVKTPDGSGIDASEGEWSLELPVEDAAAYANMARNVADISRLAREQRQAIDVLQKGNVTLVQRMNALTDAVILQSAETKALLKSINQLLERSKP